MELRQTQQPRARASTSASGAHARSAGGEHLPAPAPKEHMHGVQGGGLCQHQRIRSRCKECAHRAKKLDGNAPAPASIRARARYAEYCARKGALSKANQAMTLDLTPSAAPTNINELRAKNPEPTHPHRDPVTQPASLIWRGGKKKKGKST